MSKLIEVQRVIDFSMSPLVNYVVFLSLRFTSVVFLCMHALYDTMHVHYIYYILSVVTSVISFFSVVE